MRWELMKVFSSRALVLLLAALLPINCLLFLSAVSSEELNRLNFAYKHVEELDMLTAELQEAVYYGTDYPYELVTGSIYSELRLYEDVLDRIETVNDYDSLIETILLEAHVKKETGLFESKYDSFDLRSLQLTEKVYSTLVGTEPESFFSAGFEVFLFFRTGDALALLAGISAALVLFCQERERGTLCLLRPTKRGRSTLFLSKAVAILGLGLFALLVMYGLNFATISFMYEPINLYLPIQSVYAFARCPYDLSIGSFLICFAVSKMLWLVSTLCVFMLLSCLFGRILTLLCSAITAALSFTLSLSHSILLRSLNLLSAGDVAGQYTSLLFLDVIGLPVPRAMATGVFCTFTAVMSFATAMALFCCRPAVHVSRHRRIALWTPGRRVGSYRHEARKLWLSSGGAAALVALMLIQFFSCFREESSTPYEEIYKKYSEILSGAPSPDKDAYLVSEAGRFETLRLDSLALMDRMDDIPALSLYVTDLLGELEAEEAFLDAKSQYESLSIGQEFVCRTPYERLFGRNGLELDANDLAKCFLALIITLPIFFCMEWETGVRQLIISIGVSRSLAKRKRIIAVAFSIIAITGAFLPRAVTVIAAQGLPMLDAQANSLALFAHLPNYIPLWGIFVVVVLVRAALAVAVVLIIEALSQRIHSFIPTIMFSLLILQGAAILLYVCFI